MAGLLLLLLIPWVSPVTSLPSCPFGPCQLDNNEAECSCSDTGQCFYSWGLCGGWPQCHDKSDEWDSVCDCVNSPLVLVPCLDADLGFDVCRFGSICDGVSNCDNYEDETPQLCDGCETFGLLRCWRVDKEVCIAESDVCDGTAHCSDDADELASECNDCQDMPEAFECTRNGHEVCMDKKFQCDGVSHCDNYEDETPGLCDGCNGGQVGLLACWRNGTEICVAESDACDGVQHCTDYEDELATRCDDCGREDLFKCKVEVDEVEVEVCFPSSVLCDGTLHCSDFFDESPSQCKECSIGDLFRCQ